ncbi:MAG: hypothetical protein ACI4C1_08485 [Lachnospiraceae bacterium]
MKIKKKHGILMFLCSLMPGAGQMYLGFMKLGVSIMTLFFGVTMIAMYLSQGELIMIVPIIWCYSFFDAHNRVGLSDEEFYALEDHYLISFDQMEWNSIINGKKNTLVASFLIFVGILLLWKELIGFIGSTELFYVTMWGRALSYFLEYQVPKLAIAGVLIWLGITMIRGKKQQLDKDAELECMEEKNDL